MKMEQQHDATGTNSKRDLEGERGDCSLQLSQVEQSSSPLETGGLNIMISPQLSQQGEEAVNLYRSAASAASNAGNLNTPTSVFVTSKDTEPYNHQLLIQQQQQHQQLHNMNSNEPGHGTSNSGNNNRESSPQGRYFRLDDRLGSGAYKDVWRAYDTNEGIEVAWNVVKLSRIPPNERKRIKTEVKLLKDLEHPNIIRYFNSWVDREKEQIVFITEIMSSGSLKDYLRKSPMIRWAAVKRWCLQILEGLKFLHVNHIIHRDIKCDNIFINGATGELRIGDLGLSTRIAEERNDSTFGNNSNRIVTASSMTCVGTPEFMAPELYEEVYDEKVDIYAFGMTLLEMVTGLMPYHQCTSAAQIYKKVTNGEPPPELDLVGSSSQKGKEFIELCLLLCDQRPSAQELLDNVFLSPNEDDDFKEVRTKSDIPSLTESGRIESGEFQSEASSHGSIFRNDRVAVGSNTSGEIVGGGNENSHRTYNLGKPIDVTEIAVIDSIDQGGLATRPRDNSNPSLMNHIEGGQSTINILTSDNQNLGQLSYHASSNDSHGSTDNTANTNSTQNTDSNKNNVAVNHSTIRQEDGIIGDYNIDMLQTLSQTHTALLRRKIVDNNRTPPGSGVSSLDGASPISSRGNSAVQTRGVWGIKHNSSSNKHSSGDLPKGSMSILEESVDTRGRGQLDEDMITHDERNDNQDIISMVSSSDSHDSNHNSANSLNNDIFNGLVNSIKKIAKISLSTYVCDIQPLDGLITTASFDALVFHMRLAFNTQIANMKDHKIAHYEIEFDFNINNDDVNAQSEEMLQYIINQTDSKLIEYSQNYLDVIIKAYKPFVDSWLIVGEKYTDLIAKSTEETIENIHKSFIESIIRDVLSREEYLNSYQFNRIREKYSYLMPNVTYPASTSTHIHKYTNNSNSTTNNKNTSNSNNNISNINNNTNFLTHNFNLERTTGSPANVPSNAGFQPTHMQNPEHISSSLLQPLRGSETIVSICSPASIPSWLHGNHEYLDLLERYNAAVGKIEKELDHRMGVINSNRAKKEEEYKREKEQLVNKLEDLKNQLITMQDKQKERIHEVEEKKKQLETRIKA